MIFADSIPLPDNIFWYSVAVGFFFVLVWIAKWWIGRVESRQDAADMKFNTVLQQMSEMNQTQALQNQVLEQHSKYIENEGSSIKNMAETMLDMLQFLKGGSDKDDANPTVQRFRNKL